MLIYGYIKLTDRGMTMPRDKTANHIKLMGAARQEFLECGFEKASMRSDEWLNAHIARYVDAVNSGQKVTWSDSEVDMMREIIYPNMEDYHLLLSGSQGTKYENYLHDLTEQRQRELLNYLPMLRALHLLLTAYTTALFEPVMHNYSQEEALSCLETVEAFFLPGWKNLFGI